MAQLLENQPRKNPALSLLAMILQGGSIELAPTGLRVLPDRLRERLRGQIIANKSDLIRLLLRLDCPCCGFPTRREAMTSPDGQKLILRDFCPMNPAHFDESKNHPEIRVFDKSGKEI